MDTFFNFIFRKNLTSILLFILVFSAKISYTYYNNQDERITFSPDGLITITLQEVNPAARTYFDMQAGACSHTFCQEDALRMHAVFVRDPYMDSPLFTNRKIYYFYSTDGGNSWQNIGYDDTAQAGYPCLTLMNNGRAAILQNTKEGGVAGRSQIFLDVASGVGAFSRLDSGYPYASYNQPAFPVGVSTNNDRIVFIASVDSTFRNVCTSVIGSGTFSGYVAQPEIASIQSYSLARNGSKVGIAYITGNYSVHLLGSVYFMESTDNGTTWGSPVPVWLANYNTDSLGSFRSVDVTYNGTSPCVVFSLGKLIGTGGFFIQKPSKLMFWSPAVNGGNPVKLDSAGGLTGTNPNSDNTFSVCRGVIGAANTPNYLFCAYDRARPDTDLAGNNYFDIYFIYSTNGGVNWQPPVQVTNPPSTPLRDCRFPAIPPTTNLTNGAAYIIYQQDSIAGSYVNGAAPSLARLYFAKISSLVGIFRNSTNIPEKYLLYQNYPNPFNPSTVIRFQVAMPDGRQAGYRLIQLKIYDILGREVSTLINEKLNPGSYEVEWEGTNYPSGIYFYSLVVSGAEPTGGFTETRKMVLLK